MPAPRLRRPRHYNHGCRRADRRGAVLVEFVACLPVITLLILGTIEACELVYLKRTATQAAYEAARTSLVPNTTTAQARVAAQRVLDDRNVSEATISIVPVDVASAAPGTYVAVDVTAPANGNIFTCLFTTSSTVQGHVEMMKEF